MDLNEPEFLIDVSRNPREEVSGIQITKFIGAINRNTHSLADLCHRVRENLHMIPTARDVQGIRCQLCELVDSVNCSFGCSTECYDPFRHSIYELFGFVSHAVKQLVQCDKRRTFHVPMSLLGLKLQVNPIRQSLIEKLCHRRLCFGWKIVFGRVHFLHSLKSLFARSAAIF